MQNYSSTTPLYVPIDIGKNVNVFAAYQHGFHKKGKWADRIARRARLGCAQNKRRA
jgi:hypothetical protein